jgi:hypothetical protein
MLVSNSECSLPQLIQYVWSNSTFASHFDTLYLPYHRQFTHFDFVKTLARLPMLYS